jgi:hypothetical protein
MLVDKNIETRGYLGVSWNILIKGTISGYSIGFLILLSSIAISLIKRKNITKLM